MKFKIGDRVKCTKSVIDSYKMIGLEGIILNENSDRFHGDNSCTVSFIREDGSNIN